MNAVNTTLSSQTGTGSFVGSSGSTLTNTNLTLGFATTATAAGTTILTVTSAQIQEFTGSTTQTVRMPVTSTLTVGHQYYIINNSSGVVTIQSSGANTIQSLAANTSCLLTVVLTSGTTAASWQSAYITDGGLSPPGPAGTVLWSDGSAWIPTTATYPNVATSTGTQLRADGTNWVPSTATWADTYSLNTILYASSANTITGLASANRAVMTTGATGIPVMTALNANGQLIIGSTAGVPAAATLTAGTGISISNASNSITISATSSVPTAPTIQQFTSGSGTYTTPANVSYIRVVMVGGGGGGGGSGSTVGTVGGTGGTTTFGSSLLTCTGGVGGRAALEGGDGGSYTIGAGAVGFGALGGHGAPSLNLALVAGSAEGIVIGGNGGSSALGGAGGGGYSGQGTAGQVNTGGGGGGTGIAAPGAGTSVYSGSGGGAGGYIEAIIDSPSATYSYTVGAGGTAGGAGTSGVAGVVGGSGLITVFEYYA